jgi:CRP-like cAMP-binding protein
MLRNAAGTGACLMDRNRSETLTNRLLAALQSSDAVTINSYLRHMSLRQGQTLFDIGDNVNAVFFPINAIVSLVVPLQSGKVVEAAMVGNDGIVGAAAALDGSMAVNRAVVQRSGEAISWETLHFKRYVMDHRDFHSLIMSHEQSLYAQAQQSAACNISHDIEERLARWLARADDLTLDNELDFTQDYLAEMLGVRRTSVTTAASALQLRGLIEYNRGKIRILDRDRLRATACECYETNKNIYNMVMKAHLDALKS